MFPEKLNVNGLKPW